jgi:hypothetical protein
MATVLTSNLQSGTACIAMYHAPMFFLQTGTLFVFLIPYKNGLALKNPVL